MLLPPTCESKSWKAVDQDSLDSSTTCENSDLSCGSRHYYLLPMLDVANIAFLIKHLSLALCVVERSDFFAVFLVQKM